MTREAHRTAIRYSLGGLLAFGALNAFGGGYYGLAGAAGVPTEWLKGSPFPDYFVPSLILLVVVGGSFLVAAIAVFGSPANRSACGLRRRPRRPGLAGRADCDHRLRVLDAADDGHRRHVGARPGLAAPSTSMNAALRRIQPDGRARPAADDGKYFAARGETRGHDTHHSSATWTDHSGQTAGQSPTFAGADRMASWLLIRTAHPRGIRRS